MDALGSLDEISERTSGRVNGHGRRGKFGWAVSPNIERASVAREAKQALPERKIATAAEITPNKPHPKPSAAVARMISSYDDLISAFRERVDGLNISRHELDHLAGLTLGHSGKLLGQAQVKRFGSVTLGLMLGAIGCKLILVEDPEQTAKIRKHAQPVDHANQRFDNKCNSKTVPKIAAPQNKTLPVSRTHFRGVQGKRRGGKYE
jgi:hypothetical protein